MKKNFFNFLETTLINFKYKCIFLNWDFCQGENSTVPLPLFYSNKYTYELLETY